jgi:hypothetical protein
LNLISTFSHSIHLPPVTNYQTHLTRQSLSQLLHFAPEKRKRPPLSASADRNGLLLNLYKSSGSTYRIPPEQPQIWFGLIDLLLHNFPFGQGKTSLMATSVSLSGTVS